MKKLCILLVVLISTASYSQKIARDKQLHLGAGFLVGAWGTLIPEDKNLKPILYGIGASVVAGAGKELVDMGGFGKPDIKDFGATVIGGVVSVGIITGVKAIIKHHKRHKICAF